MDHSRAVGAHDDRSSVASLRMNLNRDNRDNLVIDAMGSLEAEFRSRWRELNVPRNRDDFPAPVPGLFREPI